MSAEVDLRELAIDRGGDAPNGVRPRPHLWSRYVLPLVLIGGFFSLIVWASWERLFPARAVQVVPVLSSSTEVRQEGTPLFQAAGWIEPRPTPVRVAALAPGVVEKLLVVEDQPVKAGEPIAQLVKEDAKLTVQSAQADLELREAELDEAKSSLAAAETRFKQPVHLEAALGEASASLAKIETQLKNLPFELRRAEADSEAMQKDYEGKKDAEGVVAGVQIDIAKGKLDASRALVEELKNRHASLTEEQKALSQRRDALKTQLELLADEIKARDGAKARLKAAKAKKAQASVALAEAELRLDRMTIRAPIAGRVYQLIAHPGARIGAGMTQMQGHDGSTVVTLYRPEMLQVRVDVRFEDIPKVSLGQPVEIDNPALTEPTRGTVLYISSEADIQKNTLQVKVEVPVSQPVFKPEMLVDVTFLSPKPPEDAERSTEEVRLYVLKQFIHADDAGDYVWLADRSAGVARKARVETGRDGNNGLMEITSGLTAASRIISSGIEGLEEGDRIRVTGQETSGSEMKGGE